MRTHRVGLVCPYSLDVPGGVQNHVRDLAGVLIARGHRVGVLTAGDDDTGLPDYIETAGRAVPVRFNGATARLSFGPRVAARARRWLAEGDFDVLHVHEPAIPSLSMIAVWAAEIPVVATFHSALTRSRAMASASAVLRPTLEKITARIAVSEAARTTLVQHHGGEPLVIPNGLRCDEFEQAQPRPEWCEPGPTVAFLGRTTDPRKGLPVLLRAFPEVLVRHPTARLLVAGRGTQDILDPLPPAARRRAEYLGQVSDAARSRLLASATVYVAPQTGSESFGIVLVEAMAARTAVVASDLDAFRTVLRDGELGALFRAGDSAAAAGTINAVLANPARRKATVDRAATEVRRYDWSVVATEIEAVYDTVAASDVGESVHG
jgi:phosphatidyl-myo-inositol alpha-mannosyltransferase